MEGQHLAYIFLRWSVNKSDYPVVKKISCDVIIENKYPKIICFIVKCYYNKSLVSKKWLKIIVLELYNKCI